MKGKDHSKALGEASLEVIRLNKLISDTGFCSRREADKLIDQGKVTVNGLVAVMGTKALRSDRVMVAGKLLQQGKKRIYLALNKPRGITCTTELKVKGNIVDFVHHSERIFPIGRLDKDSEGLIFLTNDGDIVNKILRAGNGHEKEYVVTVDKAITPGFIRGMSQGVPILDTITQHCWVRKEGKHTFRIILTQGLNRQIRRMSEYFGYHVTKLERVRIMNISLENLPRGKWRYLTAQEMKGIEALIENSSKTQSSAELN